MKFTAILIILVSIFYMALKPSSLNSSILKGLPAYRLAPDSPVQKTATQPKSIYKDGFFLTLTHDFSAEALVLSKKNYYFGTESNLSSVDLVLGWGPMSNPNPLKMITITQSGRWYHFRYKNAPPIDHHAIQINSANMHMIAANNSIKKKIKSIRAGDIVSLKGYLVSATKTDNRDWYWKSSTSRHDKGNGSCEIVYVEDIKISKYKK